MHYILVSQAAQDQINTLHRLPVTETAVDLRARPEKIADPDKSDGTQKLKTSKSRLLLKPQATHAASPMYSTSSDTPSSF